MDYLTNPGPHFTVFQNFIWKSLCGPTPDLVEFVIFTETRHISWPEGLDKVIVSRNPGELILTLDSELGLMVAEETSLEAKLYVSSFSPIAFLQLIQPLLKCEPFPLSSLPPPGW